MSTVFTDIQERIPDGLVLLRASDIIARRIAPTRKTLREWMLREVDPFPAPVILSEGKLQPGSKNRFSGRHIAWKLRDVEQWIERRAKGKGAA